MTEIPKLRDFDDPNFNPFFDETVAYGANDSPYPMLAELRKKGPVQKGDYRVMMGLRPDVTMPPDAPHYMILTYELCVKALQSPEIFTNRAYGFNLGISFGQSVSTMDGEEHARYRRIFQKVFLPKNIIDWGTKIVDPIVTELMEGFIHTGKADLVPQFTHLYPFRVIYRQLGLSPDEASVFFRLAMAQSLIAGDKEHAVEASTKLGEYFPPLIAERRAHPGNDLVSLLAGAEVDGEKLPENVLVSFLRQLVNAAGDTTYRGTSVLITKLLENPDQLEALRQDRSLLPNAIDEALRIDGPVIDHMRMTAVDTEIGGVKIPKGALVSVMAGAANHDPKVFADPDRFDIRRENANRHIAFSTGPHVCIGQHLARIEMTRAMTAILDRLHNLRLDPDKPKPRIRGAGLRTPRHIYVLFDPV